MALFVYKHIVVQSWHVSIRISTCCSDMVVFGCGSASDSTLRLLRSPLGTSTIALDNTLAAFPQCVDCYTSRDEDRRPGDPPSLSEADRHLLLHKRH